MEQRILNIELRTKTGKGICRQLRKKELIPAVVYGKGMESVPVSLSQKELSAAITGEGGQNHLLTLKGGQPRWPAGDRRRPSPGLPQGDPAPRGSAQDKHGR